MASFVTFRISYQFWSVIIALVALVLQIPTVASFLPTFSLRPAIRGGNHFSTDDLMPSLLRMSTQGTTADVDTIIWTREQLEDFADREGVVLSLTSLGPGYRGLVRAKHNTSQILGYVEGFVRPTGNLLHIDKMEVFRKLVKQARSENPDEFRGGGNRLGVGLLIAYLCLLHGQEQGCDTAEFLAIDDEDFQHKRLVRLYQHAGFDVIKYVGDEFTDIPDRMVWGGCGTLMRKDIPTLLRFWTRILERGLGKK